MKALNKILGLLPVVAALMLTACSSDDNMTEKTQAPEEPTAEWKTIPFTATVGADDASTRASLSSSDYKTLTFSSDDKLYVWGTNVKGVLNYVSGATTASATFSGTLSYTGSAPTSSTALNATLIDSYATTEGTEYTVNADGSVTINYPTGTGVDFPRWPTDAVQKYSFLTTETPTTYGAKSFTLKQQTAFLYFKMFVNESNGVSAGSHRNVSFTNGSTTISGQGTIDAGCQYIGFVVPMAKGTVLSNATVTAEGYTFTATRSITNATLAPKVYNIERNIINVGDVITTENLVYPTAAAATADSKTPVAMIAHIGNIDHYCYKFLAIALEDFGQQVSFETANGNASTDKSLAKWASTHGITIDNTTYNGNALSGVSGNVYDKVNTGESNQTATVSVIKGWRIPTVTDWRYIMAGLTSNMPTPLDPAYSATSPSGIESGHGAIYGNGHVYSGEDVTLFEKINTAWGLNLQATFNNPYAPVYMTSSELQTVSTEIWRLVSYTGDKSYNFFDGIEKNADRINSDVKVMGRAVFAY